MAGSGAGATSEGGVLSWFVRRAGLARCTTIAAAAGLASAGLAPGRWALAVSGLTIALVGMLAGHVAQRLRPRAKAGLALVLASVVLTGLFGGLLLGTMRLSSLLSGVLPSRMGQAVQAEVVVTGPVSSNSGWQSATAVVVSLKDAAGKAGRARARTGAGESVLVEVPPAKGASGAAAGASLFQGARLLVKGTLVAPDGPSASGYDQATHLLHEGIRVVLEAGSPADVTCLGRRGGISGWFDRVREAAIVHLSRGPDARVNEVLQGVVMGDTTGIDDGWMNAFRRSGTAHMLSVSGLHVASLAAIVMALAGFARLSRRAGFVLAAGAALMMVPLVGPSPPVVRSAAMMVVVLGGRLVGRRRDQWQGLAFAAIVVLGINPFAVFDVGFQLSFSAFAGMLTLVRPFERLFSRFPDAVRADLAVSVAATLGTAPVSLLVFGRTSLISPVANLLVVPTLGLVTGLGMASVVTGFVWSGFSLALDTLASVPMMWTILVSTVCARVPVLGADRIRMVLVGAAAAAVALPAGLALCGRTVRPPLGVRLPLFDRTLGWVRRRRPHKRRRAAALGVFIVVVAAVLGAAAYPAGASGLRSAQLLVGSSGWPAQTEVRVLDVGQGTAVLVRTADHHAALFDAGPGTCGLSAQLRALGVKRLDLVIVSHPHEDHFGGLAGAAGSLEVGTFIDRAQVEAPPATRGATGATRGLTARYSAGGAEARAYLELRAQLAAHGTHILLASSGAKFTFHDVKLTLFAPPKPLVMLQGGEPWGEGRSPPTGDELNAGSIVTLLQVDGASFLLPGDAEADVLDTYELPAVDVLVVGHHGSRGAVTADLLARLRPKVAAISVGKHNTYGHPDPSTIATLRAAQKTVIRTDESGWVSLHMKDGGLAVSVERKIRGP